MLWRNQQYKIMRQQQSSHQSSTSKYIFNDQGQPSKNMNSTQGGVPPPAPGRIHHQKQIQAPGANQALTSQAVDGFLNTGQGSMTNQMISPGGVGGGTSGMNGGSQAPNKILPHPDPQSQTIYDLMNLQQQQNNSQNQQHRTGVGGANGIQGGSSASGVPQSILSNAGINTNRRDLKIPHVNIGGKNQSQRQVTSQITKNSQNYGLSVNNQQVTSFQQQFEEFATNHALSSQPTIGTNNFRQQAQQYQTTISTIGPSTQSVSVIGQGIGTQGTQAQGMTSNGPHQVNQGEILPGHFSCNQNSGQNTVSYEVNERQGGGNMATTLPTLTGTRSSFHQRHRPTLLPPTVLSNSGAINSTQEVAPQTNSVIQTTISQFQQTPLCSGQPPQITGTNMKLRSLPRRQYKYLNNGGQYPALNQTPAFDEDNNQSRQNRVSTQLSGENFLQGVIHQNMPLIRNSPIEISRIDTQQRISSQLGFHHGIQVTGQSAFNNQSQNLLVPPQPYQIQEDRQQQSPVLQPIQVKHRLGSVSNTGTGIGATLEPSPIPLLSKIASNSNSQAQQLMSPGQFYVIPTQNSITSTLNYESQNEMTGPSSFQGGNQNSNRDIKIRKLNPSHQKPSKRFTQQPPAGNQLHGHHQNQMSITGQNPLNYLREIASQPSTMVKANSRRNIEYHNALGEGSAPQIQSQGVMYTDFSIRKRLEEAAYKMESPHENNMIGFNSHLISKNNLMAESRSNFQTQNKIIVSDGSSVNNETSSAVNYQKNKTQFSTEDRKRKFTTYTKFTNQVSKIQNQLAQQNFEHLRAASQIKSGNSGFACIPNVISYASPNLASPNLLSADQVQPGPALTPKNTFNDNKKQEGPPPQRTTTKNDIEDSQTNMILQLESFEDMQTMPYVAINIEQIEKELISPILHTKSHPKVGGSGHQTQDDIYIGSVDIHKNHNSDQDGQQLSSGEKQIRERQNQFNGIEISGFDIKTQSSQEFNKQSKDASPDKKYSSYQDESEKPLNATSSVIKNLDIIEETAEDRSNHSHQRDNSTVLRHSTENLSSQNKEKIVHFQDAIEDSRQLPLLNKLASQGDVNFNDSALNTSIEGGSPILSKFLSWRKNNEAFNRIYKKILESNMITLNPIGIEIPIDFINEIQKLSEISLTGNLGHLSVDEIKSCLHTLKKNQQIRERFQNPYLKKIRQKSFGAVSRSGDLNHNVPGAVSSSSMIEENIVVNGMSNSIGSMSRSLSQAMVNIRNYAPQQNDHNTTPNQVTNNHKPILQINGSNKQTTTQPFHFKAQFQIKSIQEKEAPKTVQKSQMNISSSPSNKVTVGIEDSGGNSLPEKHVLSFESKSPTGSGGGHPNKANEGLTTAEVKRLQYSQKHTSNKVMFALGGPHIDIAPGTLKPQHKVKSLQHNKSQDNDANSSQKSDPLNQNRLNKLSSGSRTDSYYIPNSGESFHYQTQGGAFPQRMTHRQSKSLVRHNGPHQNPYNGEYMVATNGGSSGSGSKMFNDVLNGSKAVLTERINAALHEKVQGNLVKWRQIRKLGQGTSGEVFLAQDIVKSNALAPYFFVVKKLNIFSYNSGIDQNAILKLKNEIEVYRKLNHDNIVKYIGSEIVSNQFCIYLEYMSGGSIQMIYQHLQSKKLPEDTIKLYTRQILTGISYLHSNKVVHCDLKGANVLVDEATQIVKLTDFGCAKLFESSISHSDMNGAIRGSLAWMAPEVLMNKGIRRKADIWSLGCLVLEMAVGGNPWGSELFSGNNFQAMLKIVDPSSFPPIPSTLSQECQDFIKRCLTRDYDSRPSAEDLQTHPWILDYSQPRFIDEAKSHDSNPQSAF